MNVIKKETIITTVIFIKAIKGNTTIVMNKIKKCKRIKFGDKIRSMPIINNNTKMYQPLKNKIESDSKSIKNHSKAILETLKTKEMYKTEITKV
jgi:hypothetical protein